MFSEVPDFKIWFPEPDGFPRPEWKTIREWIRSHADEDHWDSAWQEIARVWLEKICERLGGAYTTAESDNFHLLSELDEKPRRELLIFLEQARARILSTLVDITLPKRYGKHAVLRFTTQEEYYRYVAYFDSEGEHAGSSGSLLSRGYIHIAYPHDDTPGEDRATLAHELTHNLLRSFPLPRWLNEAFAMLFEGDLAGHRPPMLTREQAAKHHAYWNAQTIQEFWRGISFSKPEGANLAYSMSRILLDFIVTDLKPAPPDFRDFVIHADRKDGGQAAARNYLGVELNDLVSAFLGPGEWTPILN